MSNAATARLNALADSYWNDAAAMKRDPEHFTSYDCVAYSTIAKELRKVAAIVADPDAAAFEVDRIRGVLSDLPKGTKP